MKPQLEIQYGRQSTGLGITTSWTTYDQAVIVYNEAYLNYGGTVSEQFQTRTDIPLKLEVVESPKPQLQVVY